MSSKQSFLSAPHYGYDVTLGVTEASVNATMKRYLSRLPYPEVVICFVDKNRSPAIVSYEELKKAANGSDPFAIPAGADPETDPDIMNLKKARFLCAFKARIGVPKGVMPSKVHDLVGFTQNPKSVVFTLMCAEFQIASIEYPKFPLDPVKWLTITQPKDNPWLFTSTVDLTLIDVPKEQYKLLEGPIKTEIANREKQKADFSISRLFFDFNNAKVQSIPEISGVDAETSALLNVYFVGVYFKKLQENGEPVLGYTLSLNSAAANDHSSLNITTTKLTVSPYVDENGQPVTHPSKDQRRVSTLNYQCAVDDKILPPTVPFNWNWVEIPQSADMHGVISINRGTFINYLYRKIQSDLARNCFVPWVRTSMDGISKVRYEWRLSPFGTGTPQITASGPDVFTFSFKSEASDTAGSVIEMGSMRLESNFNAQIKFLGDTIVITQHLRIYLKAQFGANSGGGNVVDKKFIDTYTMSMIDNILEFKRHDKSEDNSKVDHINPVADAFIHLNAVIDKIAGWVTQFTAPAVSNIALDSMQHFMFPAGNVFAFKDVRFSDHQDLISHITYLDKESLQYIKM